MEIKKIEGVKEVIEVGDFLLDEYDDMFLMVVKTFNEFCLIDMQDGHTVNRYLSMDSLRKAYSDYMLLKNKDVCIQIPYY